MNAPALAELLAEAEAAFVASDPLAAAQAVERAAQVCAELAASHTPPDRGTLPRLLEQRARLELCARKVRDLLSSKLSQAGRSRRAVAAYRRR